MKPRPVSMALAAIALCIAAPAQATLLGDRIDIMIDLADPHSDQQYLDVEVVSPGAEGSAGWTGPLFFAFGQVDVDVDDSSVWITIFGGTEGPQIEAAFAPAFEIWLSDLDWVGEPGFVIDEVIPLPGNTADVSVTMVGPHDIHFSYPGFVDDTGAFTFTQMAHFDITHKVPEPAFLALCIPAAALLARVRRGRRTA